MSFGDGDLHAQVAQLKTENQRLTAQVDKLKGLNGVLCDEINEKDRRIRELESGAWMVDELETDDGKVTAVIFNGVRYVKERTCKLTHTSIPILGHEDASFEIYETECGERVFSDYKHCPYCGGRIAEVVGE